MIKRSFAVLAIIVVALITTTALPTLSTTEAASSQRTIWNATGLQQTKSTYWEPTLNQPTDYVSPVNLVGGTAYMRLDVLEKPSDMFVAPMVCFWRHGATKFAEETCAAGRKHPFTSEGTYYLDLGTPDSWWQKNGEFDWTKPVSLGRIMIRDGVKGGRLLLNERCGGACYLGDDLDDHVPIKMSSQLIFVPRGQTLSPPSGWRTGCPGSWSSSCQGDEVTPVTTTPSPTTTPVTTAPAVTTTTVPTPTTLPIPAFIDAEPGIASLDVSYSIPRAVLYQVRYIPDGGKTVWTDPTTATSRTLRNLQPGKRYTVSVRGLINNTWRSWMSTTATPQSNDPSTTTTTTTTTTAPAVTSPPTTAAPSPAYIDAEPGIAGLDVSYSIPRAVLYQVRYIPDGGKTVWTDPTTATSRTLRNLQPGKRYTVSVRGLINNIWRSWMSTTATPQSNDPSTTTTTTTTTTAPAVTSPPTTAAPSPAYIDAEPGIASLDVSYSIPRAVLYQVRYIPDGGKTVWTDPTTATSRTLRNLQPGKRYTVSVRGLINNTWRSWMSTTATPQSNDPSTTTTTTTTTTAPAVTSPPTTAAPSPAYINAEPGVWILTVSYGIPNAVLYQVRYWQEGKSPQWTEPTEATTQTLPGLRPGKLHTVEVRGLVAGTWRNWISTTAIPLA